MMSGRLVLLTTAIRLCHFKRNVKHVKHTVSLINKLTNMSKLLLYKKNKKVMACY